MIKQFQNNLVYNLSNYKCLFNNRSLIGYSILNYLVCPLFILYDQTIFWHIRVTKLWQVYQLSSTFCFLLMNLYSPAFFPYHHYEFFFLTRFWLIDIHIWWVHLFFLCFYQIIHLTLYLMKFELKLRVQNFF